MYMEIKTPADRRLAESILALVRGLKLSQDLDLAESAIHVERELLAQLGGDQAELTFPRPRRAMEVARQA